MAVIGIRYPIWSPYVSGGEGAAIVYGEAVTTDEIIEANVSWTRNTNVLYASDRAVETDNSITERQDHCEPWTMFRPGLAYQYAWHDWRRFARDL